jgi:penicillin-insensitive murein endopeptidase
VDRILLAEMTAMIMRAIVAYVLLAAFWAMCGSAAAQGNAAEEAAHRAAVLARLPADAAQRLFGQAQTSAPGPAEAIGSYERGCLEGAVQLPADGPNWQVMRPLRDRAWGHPALIAFIGRLAPKLPAEAGWPGLLIGDIAQPRGGPMLTGHGSHQLGIEAGLWLTPMPDHRLSPAEREEMSATDVVAANGESVDPAVWTQRYRRLLETFARQPQVARIFVNPAIKQALCSEAGTDRAWLHKIRPWWGQECHDQTPPPPGDGCGQQLAWWFTPEARHPPASRAKPLLIADLPRACARLVESPGATRSPKDPSRGRIQP